MKLHLQILMFFLAAMMVKAQAHGGFSHTPGKVQHVLDSLYPAPKEVYWSKKNKRYTADFIYEGRNVSLTLDKDGNVIKGLEEISFGHLPESVREKVEQFYGQYKIIMVSRKILPRKTEFDIEVIQGKRHYVLNYNEKGFLLHQYQLYKHDPAKDFSN